MWFKYAEENTTFGFHLIIDISDCNDNIKSKEKIEEFLKEMVKKLKMNAVGKPMIKYLLPGQKNAGFSALQLIETSDITCHFVEPNSSAYIDIFSCKEYKPNIAIKIIKEYFEPKNIQYKFILRDTDKNLMREESNG